MQTFKHNSGLLDIALTKQSQSYKIGLWHEGLEIYSTTAKTKVLALKEINQIIDTPAMGIILLLWKHQ